MNILALDISSTKIKRASLKIGDQQAVFQEFPAVSMPSTGQAFTDLLGQLIATTDDIDGVAISTLGAVDTAHKWIISSGDIDYLPALGLAEKITNQYHLRCRIINNGNAATLGEYYHGNLFGVNSGVCMVLGAGIGGGILYHDELLEGQHFAAGEFSNMRTNNQWEQLNEAIFYKQNSALTLNRQRQLNPQNDDREFFTNLPNDPKLQSVLTHYCQLLMVQMYNIQLILDPDQFVIGGEVSAQPALFNYLDHARVAYAEHIGSQNLFKGYMPKIRPAKHNRTANLYGALGQYLAVEYHLSTDQVRDIFAHISSR